MRWSVGIEVEGDHVLTREEVVELADAVAASGGIATGIGTSRYGAQLIVNDYWQLALEEGCDFVHLGQSDLEQADVAALRAAGVRIGVSTHDDAELARGLSIEPDYVALGPIYPTLLKVMPWAPQGLARIGDWKRRIGSIPLVAIGGITRANAREVLAAGADSVAVIGDLFTNVHGQTKEWLAITGSAEIPSRSGRSPDRATGWSRFWPVCKTGSPRAHTCANPQTTTLSTLQSCNRKPGQESEY